MNRADFAIVQSAFDFEMREVNALEIQIVTDEDAADANLWRQAERIVKQLDAGFSQNEVAAKWINVRKNEPYSQMHVSIVARVYRQKFTFEPRPRFRDAYNDLANPSKPHVSQNSGNNEWYTPKEYIDAARTVLGRIDLDPASSPDANKVVQAARFYTLDDDGLAQPWRGRVWLNPPYAQPAVEHFANKLAESVTGKTVSAAIVLVNNATETDWFHTIATLAAAVCFPDGRVRFWSPDRDAATPLQGQAVLYIGDHVDRFAEAFGGFGVVWKRES